MHRSSSAMTRPPTGRAPVSTAGVVVASLFLLIGVLGFIPGITTDYNAIQFAGHRSNALLLGVFRVSVLHNLVHLVLGVAGLALARTAAGARTFLIGGGAINLVLWLYGLVISQDSTANFIPVNNADNWLHLLLGIGMIALGMITTRRPARR